MSDGTIVNLDKRVTLLEEKLTLYLEQINASLTRLEKTIASEMAKSKEELSLFAAVREKNREEQNHIYLI